MASYGTRGDIEPSVAVGHELQRRGHEVRMAVPPDLVGFAHATGLDAIPYGIEVEPQLGAYRDGWTRWTRRFWRIQDLVALSRDALQGATRHWAEMNRALMTLAKDADLLSTGVGYEQPAANVAQHYGIPLAVLHTFPWRPNGRIVPTLPAPVVRSGMQAYDWLLWRLTKRVEDAQRCELGLPQAKGTAARRMAEYGALEIQAYDAVCFPGLAEEWNVSHPGRRPFVGTLTMELTAADDVEVMAWIDAGSAPICFGFGSIPMQSPADTVEMISAACAELGERALVCAGGTDLRETPRFGHVHVAGVVNYAAVFPKCRAVVHHGGSGTMAASLRAGVPTLALWTAGDQPLWGAQLENLEIGAARRFSTTTRATLVADLRRILTPDCAVHAREIAAQMTAPSQSIRHAADLIERRAAAVFEP